MDEQDEVGRRRRPSHFPSRGGKGTSLSSRPPVTDDGAVLGQPDTNRKDPVASLGPFPRAAHARANIAPWNAKASSAEEPSGYAPPSASLRSESCPADTEQGESSGFRERWNSGEDVVEELLRRWTTVAV